MRIKKARDPNTLHRFQLVLPKDLFERLVVVAEQRNRSITQQIISAIEWTCRETHDEPTQHVR